MAHHELTPPCELVCRGCSREMRFDCQNTWPVRLGCGHVMCLTCTGGSLERSHASSKGTQTEDALSTTDAFTLAMVVLGAPPSGGRHAVTFSAQVRCIECRTVHPMVHAYVDNASLVWMQRRAVDAATGCGTLRGREAPPSSCCAWCSVPFDLSNVKSHNHPYCNDAHVNPVCRQCVVRHGGSRDPSWTPHQALCQQVPVYEHVSVYDNASAQCISACSLHWNELVLTGTDTHDGTPTCSCGASLSMHEYVPNVTCAAPEVQSSPREYAPLRRDSLVDTKPPSRRFVYTAEQRAQEQARRVREFTAPPRC